MEKGRAVLSKVTLRGSRVGEVLFPELSPEVEDQREIDSGTEVDDESERRALRSIFDLFSVLRTLGKKADSTRRESDRIRILLAFQSRGALIA